MTRNAATRGTARPAARSLILALALGLTSGLAAPAAAGDRAFIDFLGFSEDGRHFAFEEYGIQDGSGFPYSNIYVLDLPTDAWVTGSPFRARIDDETAALATAREQAATLAAATLDELAITRPADLIAINGDGELGDGTHLTFARPGFSPNATEGASTLRLETFEADSPEGCETFLGGKPLGFALSVVGSAGDRELFRDGEMLPSSRGCPTAYRIFAVVSPQFATPPEGHVAIIATYPFGFEGPDRRFIAIPLAQ